MILLQIKEKNITEEGVFQCLTSKTKDNAISLILSLYPTVFQIFHKSIDIMIKKNLSCDKYLANKLRKTLPTWLNIMKML